MILFPPPLPSFPSSREKGVGGLLEKTPGESFPAIKPVPSPPPGQLGSIWPGTLEAPSPAWRRCHSANNGGKERKAMRLPMLQMTSSMGDWLVLRESLLGGPGAYSLCFHSPHPLVQERTFRGGRDRPSGCEFRWKLEREGNFILGSLSLFLDQTGQATAIIQTTALHQEANHRKRNVNKQ